MFILNTRRTLIRLPLFSNPTCAYLIGSLFHEDCRQGEKRVKHLTRDSVYESRKMSEGGRPAAYQQRRRKLSLYNYFNYIHTTIYILYMYVYTYIVIYIAYIYNNYIYTTFNGIEWCIVLGKRYSFLILHYTPIYLFLKLPNLQQKSSLLP